MNFLDASDFKVSVQLIITAVTLPLAGRYLERVWGQNEYLKVIFSY